MFSIKQQKSEGFQKTKRLGEGLGEGFHRRNVRGLTKCEGCQESFHTRTRTPMNQRWYQRWITLDHTRVRVRTHARNKTFRKNPSPLTKPLTFPLRTPPLTPPLTLTLNK
jgi:hypothetical protein